MSNKIAPEKCNTKEKKENLILKENELDYYVHYINQDRRLDEWIILEKK